MIDRGEWFARLRSEQDSYQTNSKNRQLLSEKHFTAVVAPAGAGKSTVMNRTVELDNRFRRVSGFVTRPPRSNDEQGLYHYYLDDHDLDQLAQLIDDNEPVQYATDPTHDVLYGTMIDDYSGQHNLKDVWTSALPSFAKLGFKTMTVVALVADPNDWEEWFHQRFAVGDPVAQRRITEAQLALPQLIEHRDEVKWLKNTHGSLDDAAQELIYLSEGGESAVDGVKIATAMLEAAKRLEGVFARN